MISMEDIAKLRAKTDAGIMDCKKALTACDGNMDKAVEWLREQGMASMAKKADRIASNGRIGFYNHMNNGLVGVMVEVNCETDFVARSDKFIELVNNLAMHIAAARPQYISREEIPAEVIENEKQILRTQALNEGKPEAVVEKMVEGRIAKFYGEVALLDQEYVKEPDLTIADLIQQATLTIGEKIVIRRFTKYEVGEGLEKRNWNE